MRGIGKRSGHGLYRRRPDHSSRGSHGTARLPRTIPPLVNAAFAEDDLHRASRISNRESCTRPLFQSSNTLSNMRSTQEVAYGSLLQESRRALHARIVEMIERLSRAPPAIPSDWRTTPFRGEVWAKPSPISVRPHQGHRALSLSRGGGLL